MRAVSFGRSSKNNVVVNDNNVSRVHCQIVQYDSGGFGVVDFGSTNGTYVNGRRIAGQVPLRWDDTVRIGNTTLNWQPYFAQSRKPAAFPSWAWGVVAAAIVLAVTAGLLIHNGSNFKPAGLMAADDTTAIESAPFDGQIIALFSEHVPQAQAVEQIESLGGRVVGQISDIQYYLVDAAGSQADFISRASSLPGIDFLAPNGESYPKSVASYVIDNYYVSHGDNVAYTMRESGLDTPLTQFNAGDPKSKRGVFKWSEIHNDLHYILSNADNNDGHIINMSFGPGFDDDSIDYWTDAGISTATKNNYRQNYISELRALIKIAKRYDDKDFVIVKAAGNEGVKALDKEILNPLYATLTEGEKEVLHRHFMLVSAEDNRHGIYSNELSEGVHNSLVTKVDISDLYRSGRALHGTSFAAPRTASYIAQMADKKSMDVTDAVIFLKEATQKSPRHILTQSSFAEMVGAAEQRGVEMMESAQQSPVLNVEVSEESYSPATSSASPAIPAPNPNPRTSNKTRTITVEGVLRMYLNRDGYLTPLSTYRKTDWMREVVSFVVYTPSPVYAQAPERGEREWISRFEVRLSNRSHATLASYNNRKVRLTGKFDFFPAGWRNATVFVFHVDKIEML